MMINIPKTPMHRNFFHLYADVGWFGVLAGSTLYFQSVYAARLGASSLQVGLIAAGPAVIALLITLPTGSWLAGKPLIKASYWSSVAQRLWFLIYTCLPWVFVESNQVWAIVGISLLIAIPGVILAIAFNAMFAEIVPTEYRGEVVGKRNALVAISLTLTNLICGQVLDQISFPLNYQIVFGLGALGALMSSYHLGKIHPLEGQNLPVNLSRSGRQTLLRLDLLRGPFGLFLLAYLAFYTFQYLPGPLFILALVKGLNLTDGQLSLGNVIFYLTMMLASLGLGRISKRMGHRRLLVITSLLFVHYPLLLGLYWSAPIFWLVSVSGGVIYGLLSGSLLSRLIDRVPEDDRPAHMALHNMALNLGILLGSFGGPFLNGLFGLREAILLAGVLRIFAGVVIWLWG